MKTPTDKARVYMAGPIQHAQDRGKGWRERVKEQYDQLEWVDPIDKYDSASAAAEWEDERIVQEDLGLIDECEALLVHWEEVPTCGTPMEIRYAYGEDKLVVVQTTVPYDELSPWLTYHVNGVVPTFAGATNHLREVLYD